MAGAHRRRCPDTSGAPRLLPILVVAPVLFSRYWLGHRHTGPAIPPPACFLAAMMASPRPNRRTWFRSCRGAVQDGHVDGGESLLPPHPAGLLVHVHFVLAVTRLSADHCARRTLERRVIVTAERQSNVNSGQTRGVPGPPSTRSVMATSFVVSTRPARHVARQLVTLWALVRFSTDFYRFKHGERRAPLYLMEITCRLLQTVRGMKQ